MQMLIAVVLGGLGLGLLIAGARGKSQNVLGVLEGGAGLAGLAVNKGGQVVNGHGSVPAGVRKNLDQKQIDAAASRAARRQSTTPGLI